MRVFLACLGICFPLMLMGQNNPSISGSILDEASGEPVSYANVSLYETGEKQPVTGTFTDESGAFILQGINDGSYYLLVQFVGYDNHKIEDIEIEGSSVNLSIIKLAQASTELDEVVVQGQEIKRPVETSLEGMTINPSQNLSNIGGSVTDILRNAPSISVDQDGGITIRGSSSTNVLINGRNSALSEGLDQIPASAIEMIEVINNPGARYDAQGTGGVLNIVLKQGSEELLGTSGRAELTLGNRYRLNSALNLYYQGKQFNAFGGYSYRRDPDFGSSRSERFLLGDNPQRIVQISDRAQQDNSHTVNYGVDYVLNKNKFSYEGVFETENEEDHEENFNTRYNAANEVILNNVRSNTETEQNYTLDNSLIYERLYDQKGRSFRALISHSYRDNLETQNISTNDIASLGEEPERQRASTDELRENIVIQADYVQPFEQGKFEAGYKTTLRNLDNNYIFENYNNATDDWLINESVTNRFIYNEQVHALYGIYQHTFDKFEFSVGTRLEQTIVDTELTNTGEQNEQRYFNPFPSLQGLYHLTDKQSLKLTYSRRIDRPNSWRLNPFPDVSDTLNIREGNPNLQPEFIQSFEFGHKVTFLKADLTSTAFYRRTNGEVDYILTVDEESGVSTRRPENLLSRTDYGLELIGTATLTPWWDINGSATFYQRNIDGSNIDQTFTNASFAWNSKLVSNMVLPWNLSYQITGNYESPEVEAQGFDYARYYVDMSLQRKFFDTKASVNLSVRDVFNTYQFGGENNTEDFRSTFLYKRDSRRVYLSLVYNF